MGSHSTRDAAWIAARCIPEPNTGCWLWLLWCDRDGYGKPGQRGNGERLAHRISWLVYRGPIPDGASVLHRCDTPSCVNPDHLFIGDQLANMRDMIGKGRRADFRGVRHGNSKLDDAAVLAMRERFARGESSAVLAESFGVAPRTARDAIRRVTWTHVV